MTVRRFYCDCETKSTVDVTKQGAYRHTSAPGFESVIWTWAWDDEPVQGRITQGEKTLPPEVREALAEAKAGRALIVAHNANFERMVTSAYELPEKFDGTREYLPPEWFDDTAARAAIWGFPRKLATLAKVLELDIEKDTEGSRLISKFSKPRSARQGSGFNMLADHPEDAAKFLAYGITDTEVLRAIDKKLPPWPPGERETWLLDQRINDRGIPLDLKLARAAHLAVRANFIATEIKLMHLTGVANPNSNPQMQAWFRSRPGLERTRSLDADHVEAMLEKEDLDPLARQVLEVRKGISETATGKFAAMLLYTDPVDLHCRGQLLYAGAHTGRWAGRGFQPQNLPRVGFGEKDDEDYGPEMAETLRARRERDAIELVMGGHGASPETLKKLIRPCITGPITGVDFSSIEARVIAWLAGEVWALRAFMAGRDIYVETANQMGEATGQEFTRQNGKTAVLALGFAGSIGAMRKMGAVGTDAEIKVQVDAYRNANPNVQALWGDLRAVLPVGGHKIGMGQVKAYAKPAERKLFLRLPSGRALSYRKLSSRMETRVNRETGETYQQRAWGFVGSKGLWEKTWHGTLTENIVQAIARDLLVHAMHRLEEEGYEILGTVHDEVLIRGAHDLDTIDRKSVV